MAVVPLVDREDAAPEARAACDDIEASFGVELEPLVEATHRELTKSTFTKP